MDKAVVLKRIADEGLIPVVRAASTYEASQAIDALRAGGLSIIEVTMTVPGAVDVIQELTGRHGDLLVGAGTVLDVETAKACLDAGARFIVSPVLERQSVELCRRHNVPVFPGALTPTEVLTAWRCGADSVKVFPCGAIGGPGYVRTLRTLFPDIPLIPTGGVSLANAAEYLRAGALAVGVGTDLVDLDAIRSGNAEKITEYAKAYRKAVIAVRRG